MAHHKAGRIIPQRARPPNSQRLGLKIFGGQQVLAGNIIARSAPGTKLASRHQRRHLGKDSHAVRIVHGKVEFLHQSQRPHLRIGSRPMSEAAARIDGGINFSPPASHRTGGPIRGS